ncbi:MAG: hypothetical protein AAGD35_21835 [Actinomycetota bacterium]
MQNPPDDRRSPGGRDRPRSPRADDRSAAARPPRSGPASGSSPPDAAPRVPSSSPPSGRTGANGPNTEEEWEQMRRSVAMLPPGAWALTREEALRALQSLVRCLGR